MQIVAQLYQQFAADSTDASAGWKEHTLELAPARTALVVMHAWDCGLPHEYPGWRRAVEYMPRAERMLSDVFPALLEAVRNSPLRVYHVVGGERDYYSHLPGYRRALHLAGPEPEAPTVQADAALLAARSLRQREAMPGEGNRDDVTAGFRRIGFAAVTRPVGDEGVAKNGNQLGALCRADGVNHLIYVGFALNWCLLMSPGGMVDMARQGCLCSTIAEATTAVENRETAPEEREKRQALWRVAVEFGFVFRLSHFLAAIRGAAISNPPAL